MGSRCALIAAVGMLLAGNCFAQEWDAIPPWRPEFRAELFAPQMWTEPPLVQPPLDALPRIVESRDFAVAPVAYQEPLPRPELPPEPQPLENVLQPLPEMLTPTPSCATCGGCGTCGGCITCEPCIARTRWGRFACGLYSAVCCPDPCYEPRWTGIANAAFFVDGVRPVTQVRYRWDANLGLQFPDRATYYWARVGALGPSTAPRYVDLHELSMYNEVASGGFSFFINTPYRSYDTDVDRHAAGFGDLDMGTKSVLFDCELMQVAFQFRTFVPVGIGTKGLGTGHVSLEPSILVGLNIGPDTYAQAQLSEWIPLTSDGGAGAILHYHASLNQVLWRWQPAVPIIGTFEVSGWSFQDGSYTDPAFGVLPASGDTYLSAGPGLRVVVCDKLDFGIGTAFPLTDPSWADQTIRSEFRWRF